MWWHIVIVALVVVLVSSAASRTSRGMHLFAIEPQDNFFGVVGERHPVPGDQHDATDRRSRYPIFFAFMFSLLQANWTYTGYDASAHVAEETVGARVASAWGIFLSVAVSAVVGYIFLFVLTTHLPEPDTLFPATAATPTRPHTAQYYFGTGLRRLRHAADTTSSTIGGLLGAGIAIAMSFCGLSSVASAGRMLFAFSRDDGVPGSGWLKKVSHRYRTPANSLIAIVVVACLFTSPRSTSGRSVGRAAAASRSSS